jgi:hypothetical protein
MERCEVTAKSLGEFARRLSDLQKSCRHEGTEWILLEGAPGHLSARVRVCNVCEKVVESDVDRRLMRSWDRCLIHGTVKEPSGFCPHCAEEWP